MYNLFGRQAYGLTNERPCLTRALLQNFCSKRIAHARTIQANNLPTVWEWSQSLVVCFARNLCLKEGLCTVYIWMGSLLVRLLNEIFGSSVAKQFYLRTIGSALRVSFAVDIAVRISSVEKCTCGTDCGGLWTHETNKTLRFLNWRTQQDAIIKFHCDTKTWQ